MNKMKPEYLEKIYAGWLAKIIGIRLGAPIEGWTYEKIKNIYGELHHYPVDYREFAADDDSNGPLFFLRALEDSGEGRELTAQAVGEALLNYAPFEHGFFWWGGYGISTEHTAYLNLRNGIKAPGSGSIAQNGAAVAEQIGGQIFIDTWGLVCPGNPDLAAKLAEKAASVTHDGNGIYGGVFLAACIAYSFDEKNIHKIIEKGLSCIPADCEYARVVKAVIAFHNSSPQNWRNCFNYVFENFGYDRYPGHCHIIPNIAVMILALLYGKGDFSDTINICNMCGWDTDCNVGNIAVIMGIVTGLDGINYEKWRRPINDFLACSSVMGSMNIMDIPYGAAYIAKLAWSLAGEKLPPDWDRIINSPQLIDSCHFEFPGSTHAIRVRTERTTAKIQTELINTDEAAHTGKRSLKVHVMPLLAAERAYVYKKTHYTSKDFHDSRYDPSFSPLVYPGQEIHGSVFLPAYGNDCLVCMYARNASTNEIIEGEKIKLEKGKWAELSCRIPFLESGLIDEAGFAFDMLGTQRTPANLICLIDDLYFDGKPDYSITFSKDSVDQWTRFHTEISQFSKLKGLWYIEGNEAHLSCSDFAEAYTGRHDWTDYTASFELKPVTGEEHFINVRVQGAIRSYSLGFAPNGKFCLCKNENNYRILQETGYLWETDKYYTITVDVSGSRIKASVNNKELIDYTDDKNPYLYGCIGFSVRNGSHCAYRKVRCNAP
jgi:ADP-ribosylglycohydrolase